MKNRMRNSVLVIAVLALALVVLPLQAAPAEVSADSSEGASWSLDLPQVLSGWVLGLLDAASTVIPFPVDDGTATTTTDCGTTCDDGDDGEFGPTFDPNG